MADISTKPVLYKPQKDSPSTFLTVPISDTDTSIIVANNTIFQGTDPVVRLTIGIDGEVTETVEVTSYGQNGQITVVRGTPAQAWPIGAKIARVLTAADISEIQEYLNALDTDVDNINEESDILKSGWLPVTHEFYWGSANSIIIPPDTYSSYAVGDRLKLTQNNTVKYFVIYKVQDTLLSITGGDDYTLVNDTISDVYYSHQASPVGFPGYFEYTPIITWTGGTTDPTIVIARGRMMLTGKQAWLMMWILLSSNDPNANRTGFTCPPGIPTNIGDSQYGTGEASWGSDNNHVIHPIIYGNEYGGNIVYSESSNPMAPRSVPRLAVTITYLAEPIRNIQ